MQNNNIHGAPDKTEEIILADDLNDNIDDSDVYSGTDDQVDPLTPANTPRSAAQSGEHIASPQTFEATEERQGLIRKIEMYKQYFPDSCRLVDVSSLKYMDDEALGAYYLDVKFQVSARNSGNLIHKSIDLGILGLEMGGKQFYPGLEGMHKELNAKAEYNDILKELSIEWNSFSYIPPEYRLLFLVAGVALPRITMPAAGNAPAPAKKELDKSVVDKYAGM